MPGVGTDVSEEDRSGPAIGSGPVVKVGAYLALFLLGAMEALIGTFQFGRGPGSLVAICFALALLATCLLGAWGMRAAMGGVLPAVAWTGMSLLLGLETAGGSVLVSNTAPGRWFLYGGTVCAAAGVLIPLVIWTRPRQRRPLR
jgi:hypothetical protein